MVTNKLVEIKNYKIELSVDVESRMLDMEVKDHKHFFGGWGLLIDHITTSCSGSLPVQLEEDAALIDEAISRNFPNLVQALRCD